MYQKIKLKNGLRVLLVPKPEMDSMTVMVLVRTGSADESDNVLGVSHFLEHMLVQSSKKRPTPMLNADFIDSIGGVHNAFTGKIYSGYYAKVAKEFWQEAIDYLADGMLNPLFVEKEIETERTSIIEEIKMHNDIPSDALSELYSRAVYGDTPMGRSISATGENVASLTKNDLVGYYQRRYQPENTLIVVAGSWKAENSQLLDFIEKSFQFNHPASHEDFAMDYRLDPLVTTYETRPIEQSNLLIGFACPGLEDPDWHPAILLTKIIGGGMSSRMFQEIRVKRGLSYDVRSGMSSYVGCGSMGTMAGVPNEKWQEAASAIIEQYDLLRNDGVGDDELARAKKMVRGSTIVELDDTEELAWEYGMSELLLGREFKVAEELQRFEKVSQDEIRRVIDKYFAKEKIIISAIGPNIDKSTLDKLRD